MSELRIVSEIISLERKNLYVAKLVGKMTPGSHQAPKVHFCLEQLELTFAEVDFQSTAFILDCTELHYEFGDDLTSLWLLPMCKGIEECAVVAKGNTRNALENLMQLSISVPVVDELTQAIDLLHEPQL